jgi:chromosomal replication initiator protein
VAGPENRLAAHALRPFWERTATHASPLVLYGPHGAGKSHLALGLVEHWSREFPDARARYFSGADFARDYAAAVEHDRLADWRRELADTQLFVLEDVAQLTGKRAAQQELVYLLDALADREELLVVTARSLPTHSVALLPALRSRLSAGLTVALSLPSSATRRAILDELATARGLSLSKRTIHVLADALGASVRVLVSALLELDLQARSDGAELDHRRVRRFISQRYGTKPPALGEIARLTARYFGYRVADLKSADRRQPLVAGRGVAMYLARKLTDKSFQEIGSYFGGRDHTTVLHGCRRTEQLLGRDAATREAVSALKRLIHAS